MNVQLTGNHDSISKDFDRKTTESQGSVRHLPLHPLSVSSDDDTVNKASQHQRVNDLTGLQEISLQLT